jgi:SAM-dependent methyltransferase
MAETMEMNAVTEADPFLREYTSRDAILKYTKATASFGINYLLDHDYRQVYLDAIKHLPQQIAQGGIRILEFGCGGGMNLLHFVTVFGRNGFDVESAIGTDFSPVLIEAANKEAYSCLTSEQRSRVQFYAAKNETLLEDLSAGLGKERPDLEGFFHFIIGVNTIRYCHRLARQFDCARDIFRLLAPGGVCVVIDMNNRFPAFRSDLKNKLCWKRTREPGCYLPSLEEYSAAFRQTGFEVLRSDHFCWIPHSAGRLMTALFRLLSPALNVVAPSRAMRSLVIAKKPSAY